MSRILRVTEHQTLRLGDGRDGAIFEQRHWDQLARYLETAGASKYFELRHHGVQFKHYVGVIQAGDLTIEILPKVDDAADPSDDTQLTRWHGILLRMLREAGLLPQESLGTALLREKSNSLLEIYLSLFLKEVEALLHRGLVKRYRQVAEQQMALRGALQFGQHIARNLVHQERFFVRHQTYDHQHPHNQLVRQALELLPRLTASSELRGRAARALLQWPESPALKVTAATFARLSYSRKTEAYRPTIRIARLILLNYHPDIRGGQEDLVALLFNMNRLWEQYLLRTLQRRYTPLGWRVTKPAGRLFWQGQDGTRNWLEPDILVELPDDPGKRRLVIDAKWKRPNGKPAIADLRQLYAYAQYFGAHHTLLCYPHTATEADTAGFFLQPYQPPGAAESVLVQCATVFLRVGSLALTDTTNYQEDGYLQCAEIPLLAEWAKATS